MAAKKETKEKDFKYLVIVESPAKSKTLTKILGKDYLVKSSVGHIRDLPSKGLGIDVRNKFEPSYEVMSGKTKVVDELNKYAKKAETVYLASDPDREGEAIAWHLSKILKCKKSAMSRIAFNQITPDAVKNAVASPRNLNQALVDAQQARRILDRLVGYKISPLLWRKIGGRSAGRVQSIAVRLICEREEEIQAFTPEEYWSIKSDVFRDADGNAANFEVNLTHVDGKRVVSPLKEVNEDKNVVIKPDLKEDLLKRIPAANYSVTGLTTKAHSKSAKPPFKTSTLQRAASNALGFNVKRTMQVAQNLYEGIKIGTSDQVGLITYMRTDSLRIAPEAQEEAKNFIINKWGAKYYPNEPNQYGKKSKKKDVKEQDAHEAIRPTYVDKTPGELRNYLSDEQYKLYKLIWDRFVASQMTAMQLETKTLEINSRDKDLTFKASQSKTTFAGYSAVYGKTAEVSEDEETTEKESKFPLDIEKGTEIKVKDTHPSQHFTEGPPRYNEASLVKTLEELGIGRPSTYAPTVGTIIDRKYVEKVNNSNALQPTKLGIRVNELLVNHFSKFINVDFTSEMEADLDRIAENEVKWQKMLHNFYHGNKKVEGKKKRRTKEQREAEEKALLEADPLSLGFEDTVARASKEIENVVITTEHKCPKCDSFMNLKSSRFGPFLGCSRHPECDGIVNLTKEGKPAPEDRPYPDENCPECGKTSLVVRYGRYGDYLACTTKDCGHTSPIVKRTGVKCPKEGCPGEIVEKKSRFGKIFYGCDQWSKTECDAVFWYPPLDADCPDCGKKMMYKSLKRGDKIACSDTKGCGYNRLASPDDIEKYRPKVEKDQGTEEKSVFSL